MKILEFGNSRNKKIILIHGFQSPWQVWNRYIEYYKKDFHVIVPVLPGHDTDSSEDFISFEQAAAETENFCISGHGDSIYAVFGMSMGGVLAAALWQNKRLNIENIIFDGSPLVSYNSFIKKQFVNFYLNISRKARQRDEKTVKQAVNTIIAEENLNDFLSVLDNMSDTTIINCINAVGSYKLPSNIDTPNTKIYFFHGTKLNELFAVRTAKYILRHYPNACVKCFKGKGHCENSLLHPEIMLRELKDIL